MRILLDECLPRRLAAAIEGHDVRTVQQAGWAGLKNGVLLSKIDGAFDVFVTVDKNLPAQNSLSRLTFGVIVLRARSNRFESLNPLVPTIPSTLEALGPGEIAFVEG